MEWCLDWIKSVLIPSPPKKVSIVGPDSDLLCSLLFDCRVSGPLPRTQSFGHGLLLCRGVEEHCRGVIVTAFGEREEFHIQGVCQLQVPVVVLGEHSSCIGKLKQGGFDPFAPARRAALAILFWHKNGRCPFGLLPKDVARVIARMVFFQSNLDDWKLARTNQSSEWVHFQKSSLVGRFGWREGLEWLMNEMK